LDEALIYKVGWVHDFLTKIGIELKSFMAVMIFRGVPDPLPYAYDEISLLWAVCLDANKVVFFM
jgi:hypothetical protein